MSELPRWRNLFDLGPRWLYKGDHGVVMYTFGLMLDSLVDRLQLGLLARFPGHPLCPPDSLAYTGRDRVITRGPLETDEAYAVRLVQWLDTHARGGSPQALCYALRAFFTPFAVRLRIVNHNGDWFTLSEDDEESWRLQGSWNWDNGPPTDWSRFWVLIYPLNTGAFVKAGNFGDADGDVFEEPAEDNLTWDSSLTVKQVASLKLIIRSEWAKPFGTKCEKIMLVWDPNAFDPNGGGPGYPDGEWGDWEKVVSDVSQASRSFDASYIDV